MFPVLVAVLALPMACISKSYPEKQRYVIEVKRPASTGEAAPASTAPEKDADATGSTILQLGRVRVSPLFERKGFVYRSSDTTYEQDFYKEFYASPAALVRKATLDWMLSSQIFSSVRPTISAADADWILDADIHELYVDTRDGNRARAVVAIEFSLLDATSPELAVVFHKMYSAQAALSDGSGLAIVAAWTESLSQILSELEADLRRATSP
jgi:uncharacterized lipoprotein YmbA